MSARHVCCDISEIGRANFLALVSRTAEEEPDRLDGLMDLIKAVAKGPCVSEETILVQASAETHDVADAKALDSIVRAVALRIGEMVLTGDAQVTRVALVLHVEELKRDGAK